MTSYAGPFAGLDVAWLLSSRARSRQNHPFVVWEPFDGHAQTWTYGRFADTVDALAAGLIQRNVKPGETIIIHLENCVEFLLAWFACAKIGAVAVTTNSRAAPQEVAYFASHASAVAAITQPSLVDVVSSQCPELRWIAVTSHNGGSAPTSTSRPSRAEAFEALMVEDGRPRTVEQNPLRTCSVQFTSGTTARPKGVVWTHANALWGAQVNARHESLRPDDIHLIYSPLFHTNALSYSLLATLWVGATAVLTPRFSASRFWDVAVRHRCTWASMNHFTTRALLEQDVPTNHSFRLWGTPESDSPRLSKFGIKTIGWWGMTETISHGIVGDPYDEINPVGIGRIAPEYSVRVVNDDGGQVEVGQSGNLLISGVRGLSLFQEYLHDPDATRASFDDHGYFITGDRVELLENGVLRFNGRARDLLRVGGENVSALEIESIAAKVEGVREAAVVARPHSLLGDEPVIFVIPSDGSRIAEPGLADEILAACRRNLADFKVPRAVFFVEDFPRVALGKVSKAKLVETL